MVGGRLAIPKPGGHMDPDYMAAFFAERKVTGVIFSVPTLAREWAAATKDPNPAMRMWSMGGEAVSREDIAILRRAFPNVHGPVNNYGGLPLLPGAPMQRTLPRAAWETAAPSRQPPRGSSAGANEWR